MQPLNEKGWPPAARAALASCVAVVFFSSIRHIYRFGPAAMWLNVFAVVLAILVWRFRKTRRAGWLWAIVLFCTYAIAAFGMIDGLWEAVIRPYGNHFAPDWRAFERVMPQTFGFHATGLLAAAAATFACACGLETYRSSLAGERPPSRLLFVIPVTALSLALAFVVGRDAQVFEDRALTKIGVIVPLQGPSATMTRPFLQAVELALAERTTRARFRLVIADSGPNGRDAKRAIEKLIYRDRVAAIVGGISLSGQIVKPYAVRERIPHLCVCSVESIGDGEFNFTNIPLPEDEARAWVEEARRRGIRTVAILAQEYPSIQGHVDALTRAIAQSELRLVYAATFPAGTRSFSRWLDAAQVNTPDVYMIEGFNPSLDALGRELRERNVRHVASIVALSLTAEPELFEGAWYTDSNLEPDFRTRFERAYPGARLVTHMVPYAYDSTNMMLDAFDSAEDPVLYLRKLTRYQGSPGELWRKPTSGNFRSAPAVWEWRDGNAYMQSTR